jgi:hypothetical protein
MSRRVLFCLALLILLGGMALAVFVVPARTCGMDQFECFNTRNVPKFLTAIGAGIAAFTIAVVARLLPKRRSNGSINRPN